MKKEPTWKDVLRPDPVEKVMFKIFAIVIVWILLFACTPATAQTDTLALRKKIEAELIQKLNQELAERPVYFLCGSVKRNSSRSVYYVKGYQKNGMNLDSRKQPLPEWVVVFAVMPREEGKI